MSNPVTMADHIAKILADAPILTEEKRHKITTLLTGGDAK